MILDKIVSDRRIQLEDEKAKMPLESLKAAIKKSTINSKISFYNAIKGYKDISIIAEIKKASPSKGLISKDFNPEKIAQAYQKADIQAVSVLTENKNFKGGNSDLVKARQILTKPILRKDFIIDIFQVYHSCYLGADCILLIAAILNDEEISKFQTVAQMLGMDCLVEVHNEMELDRVLKSGAKIIGINNRNLNTFIVDLKNTEKLIGKIPTDKVVISESGITSNEDINYLKGLGIDGVLIGEILMRSENIIKKVSDLRGTING